MITLTGRNTSLFRFRTMIFKGECHRDLECENNCRSITEESFIRLPIGGGCQTCFTNIS